MKIYIDNENNIQLVQAHITTIFRTISIMNEGQDFTMFAQPHIYCDGKNNHIEVSYVGDDSLGILLYKTIESRLADLLPDTFDISTFTSVPQYRIEQ